jgi:hypothetical protein
MKLAVEDTQKTHFMITADGYDVAVVNRMQFNNKPLNDEDWQTLIDTVAEKLKGNDNGQD